jgi:hypothetical protein
MVSQDISLLVNEVSGRFELVFIAIILYCWLFIAPLLLLGVIFTVAIFATTALQRMLVASYNKDLNTH